MGAVLLGGSCIGARCMIGAGAVVPPGMEVPAGSVVMGVPGRVVRAVRQEEQEWIAANTREYLSLAEAHVGGRFESYRSTGRATDASSGDSGG
jgi:carbonic anhydrase/acetyltransferase-like protein (isoleucine patch superfamily)